MGETKVLIEPNTYLKKLSSGPTGSVVPPLQNLLQPQNLLSDRFLGDEDSQERGVTPDQQGSAWWGSRRQDPRPGALQGVRGTGLPDCTMPDFFLSPQSLERSRRGWARRQVLAVNTALLLVVPLLYLQTLPVP